MGGGGKVPKPDKNIGIAAREQAALGREMAGIARESLDFTKQQYTDQMAEYERLAPIFERLAQGQITSTELVNKLTQQSADDYNTIYRPIEQRVAADAATAGSEAEQEAAAGRAGIDVQRQLDIQRGVGERSMASMGVNPNAPRFQSASRTAEIIGAAARAGAETQARENERLLGDNKRLAVAGMGRGVNASVMQGVQTGGNAAAQATGLAGTGLNTQAAIGQGRTAGVATGSGMMGNAANVNASSADILNNLYASKMQGYAAKSSGSAGMWGAVGNVAGAALGAYMMSDEKAKTGKKPVSGAREAVDSMRVEKWKYKPGTPYTDAEAGEGAEHVGTYAQDFQEATGLGDGQTINVIDAIGVNMAATKELSREVRSLQKRIAQLGVRAA